MKSPHRLVFALVGAPLFLTGFYSCPQHPVLSKPAVVPDAASAELSARPVDWVDPMIGTGGFPWARGNVSPAASTPFGRVRVGPDTLFFGKRTSTSGYGSQDSHWLGFSHTRLSGTGAFEGGLLRVLPLDTEIRDAVAFRKHLVVADRRTESASPGYYSVYLPGPRVQAEMTATARTALHRYRYFRGGVSRFAYFHLNSSLSAAKDVTEIRVQADPAQKRIYVQGRLKDAFSSRYGGLPFYFVVEADRAWNAQWAFSDTESSGGSDWSPRDGGGDAYLALDFGAETDASDVSFRVGLSYVGRAGAERVLTQENSGRSFDDLVAAARDEWDALLGRISVEGGEARDRRIFYTALYHSFLMPTLMDDPNGAQHEYLGFDGTVRTADHPFYSDLSLWDTFRSVHPLYNLILKDRHPDMLRSLLLMAEQSGTLPRWPSGAGNANSMLGFPGLIVLAEAALKGVGGWDENLGFEWAKRMTTSTGRAGQECLEDFVTIGYCSVSVSHTLEYAYAFEAYSLWARKRGEDAIAAEAHAKALNFKHHWSKSRGFFVPRDRAGHLDEGISEEDSSYLSLTRAGKFYIEGNAWHWAWSPFNLAEEIIGLDAATFTDRLERFMKRGGKALGSPWPVHGYWHGNEHDYHAPYLFALAGRPDRTQAWVRELMQNKYSDHTMGLDGDDDGGAISSWYVWSSLGLFPIAGSDRYVVGSPLFDRASIRTGDSTTLEMKAEPAGGGVYLEGVEVGGSALTRAWTDEAALTMGSSIEFRRANEATPWGRP